MRPERRLKPVALLLLLCVTLPLLVRCAAPTPTVLPVTTEPPPTVATTEPPTETAVIATEAPPPTAAPTELPAPQPFDPCDPILDQAATDVSGYVPNYEFVPGQPYISGQVIVTGPEEEVDQVIADVAATGIEIEGPAAEVNLSFLPSTTPTLTVWPVIFPPDTLVIRLYNTGTDVPTTVTAINATSRQRLTPNSNLVGVFADPNYITGFEHVPDPLAADPWDIGGAPWDIGGATGFTSTATAPGQLFQEQWAFSEDPGINLLNLAGSRTVTETGAGKRVAVFDTSPFTETGGMEFNGWLQPPLRVCVSHPQPDPLPVDPANRHPDVSDHGLFVAGLVHGVAPESELHLIRSLNAEGQGDTFWLLANMSAFAGREVSLAQDPDEAGVLSDTVINLSLGVHPPDGLEGIILDQSEDEEGVTLVQWISNTTRSELANLADWSAVRAPVVSLETILSILHYHTGAVVVAAAGNGSGNRNTTTPRESQIPGSYPYVLGVEASTVDKDLACFSNDGVMAAPGGDGGAPLPTFTPASPLPNPPCYPRLAEPPCPDWGNGDCSFGVVSFVLAAHKGFAFWAGTSFATPLVSGLAALELEAGVQAEMVRERTLLTLNSDGIVDVAAAVP